jgi:hypothetical protein
MQSYCVAKKIDPFSKTWVTLFRVDTNNPAWGETMYELTDYLGCIGRYSDIFDAYRDFLLWTH